MSVKFQYTPSAYKAGKTYTAIPNVDAADLSISRASSATRINEDGLIEVMGDNVPRMDYTDGGCPVLLAEQQAENLIEYSNSPTSPNWENNGTATVTLDTDISPDGSVNASTVSGATGVSFRTNNINVNLSGFNNNDDVCSSVWLKSKGATNVRLIQRSDDGNLVFQDFNITNDWARYYTTRNVGLFTNTQFLIGGSDGDFLFYEAQTEIGIKPSSNIPTNGATAIRLSDDSIQTGDISQYIDSSNFTLEFTAKFSYLNDYISVSNGDGANSVRIFGETNTVFRANYLSNNVNNNESFITVLSVFDWHDFKLVFSNNVLDLFVDGVAATTNILNTEPRNFTFSQLSLSTPPFGSFRGQIKSIKIS